MSDVFISYARQDQAAARSLASVLEREGLSVFWDEGIPVGRNFEKVIEARIGMARAVVVLWSSLSVESEWVRAEAAEGANRGILVPVNLDGVTLPLRYRQKQTVDLSAWEPGTSSDSLRELVAGVVALVNPSSTDPIGVRLGDRQQAGSVRPARLFNRLLGVMLLSAWVGSMSLAVVVAYDFFGPNVGPTSLPSIALPLMYLALMVGGLASVMIGWLSHRSDFSRGVIQGWIWPPAAAIGQLVLLVTGGNVIGGLPASGTDILIGFLIAATVGPAVLTATAMKTRRALGSKAGWWGRAVV